MILLSIVSVAVVPSWNSAQANLNHQAELLVRNLNHAQVLAMHRATSLTINFSSTTYSVSDAGGIITDPATGTPFTISLDEGVTFSTWSDFTVDSLGRPTVGWCWPRPRLLKPCWEAIALKWLPSRPSVVW